MGAASPIVGQPDCAPVPAAFSVLLTASVSTRVPPLRGPPRGHTLRPGLPRWVDADAGVLGASCALNWPQIKVPLKPGVRRPTSRPEAALVDALRVSGSFPWGKAKGGRHTARCSESRGIPRHLESRGRKEGVGTTGVSGPSPSKAGPPFPPDVLRLLCGTSFLDKLAVVEVRRGKSE